MKVFRINVTLDEKIVYHAQERRMNKTERVKHVSLAKLSHDNDEDPLLPILSDDPNVLHNHPLAQWFINPTSSDSTTPACLDPQGPWHIEANLPIPSNSRLKFTMTNPQANVTVTHAVKITLRVERGDDEFLDREGRRKKFDIIVEAQVNLMSPYAVGAALPAYSPSATTTSNRARLDAAPVASGSRLQLQHHWSGYDNHTAMAMVSGSSSRDNAVYESIVETQDFIEGGHAPPTYHYSLAHPETLIEPDSPRGRSRNLAR